MGQTMNKTVVNEDLSEKDHIRDIDSKLFESKEMIERAMCLIRDLTTRYEYDKKIDGLPSLQTCEIGEFPGRKSYIICDHEPTRMWIIHYKPIFTKLQIIEEYLERLQANVTDAEEQYFRLNEETMIRGEA